MHDVIQMWEAITNDTARACATLHPRPRCSANAASHRHSSPNPRALRLPASPCRRRQSSRRCRSRDAAKGNRPADPTLRQPRARASRKAPLQATPPATISVLGRYSCATRSIVVTSERTTVLWKLAARSLIPCEGSSPFCTGCRPDSRTYFVTAVFNPLKLKSGRLSPMRGSANFTAFGFPSLASFSMIGPPG